MGYVRKINVELIGATALKNSEYLGKSDPYVILSIGTTEFRSKVAEDQATAPEWNEKFVIPALESDSELLIRILNDNTMAKDDELGRVVIPLAQYRHGESASSFALQCNGKAQGELKMNLAFESEDDHESKGLIEKVENLVVGEKEHHEEESVKEVEEKMEEQKEQAEEKKEESEEKTEDKAEEAEGTKEAIEEKIEEAEEKAKEKKKHKQHHRRHHKHHKKSDDEGSSSSSSDSESDKDEKD